MSLLYVVARKPLRLLCGVGSYRSFPVGGSHGVPAVWLGTVGMYPLALYTAPPLSCAAFFNKVR